MLSKKSLVLSDIDGTSNKKAVLTIQSENNDVTGSLRLYNFGYDIGLLTLGFYVDGKVVKSGLTKTSGMLYNFFLSENVLDRKFSCAVIEIKSGEPKPILYGSSEGREEDVYADIIEELSGNSSVSNVQSVLDEHQVDYDEETKKEVEEEIDKCISKDCENCVYKKYFYESKQKNNLKVEKSETEGRFEKEEYAESKNEAKEKDDIILERKKEQDLESAEELNNFVKENIEKEDCVLGGDGEKKEAENEDGDILEENEIDENIEEGDEDRKVLRDIEEEKESFIGKLKPQIDRLFEKNPIESNLESLFPNSKFVKVEYEDEGDFYVFGLLYEGGNVKYVCYGVPAVFDEEPPKELSGYPIFIPLDKEKQDGFGYWLTYQDAETGEPIKAIID